MPYSSQLGLIPGLPVPFGELHQAFRLGLNAHVSNGVLRVCCDAPVSGGVNANHAAFRNLEPFAIHMEAALRSMLLVAASMMSSALRRYQRY